MMYDLIDRIVSLDMGQRGMTGFVDAGFFTRSGSDGSVLVNVLQVIAQQ